MICEAIRERQLLALDSDGHHRLVQPAAHGNHVSTGNALLRAYQVGGSGNSRDVPFWDPLKLDRMTSLVLLDDRFDQDPPFYRPGDRHLVVHCELKRMLLLSSNMPRRSVRPTG